jgi:hypothetical protein
MVETELVVKIAAGGAAQTVRDVAKVQEALAQMGKSAKDTAALAKALGNAFKIFFLGYSATLQPGRAVAWALGLG